MKTTAEKKNMTEKSEKTLVRIFAESAALDEKLKVLLFYRILQKSPDVANRIFAAIEASMDEHTECEWQDQSLTIDGFIDGLNFQG